MPISGEGSPADAASHKAQGARAERGSLIGDDVLRNFAGDDDPSNDDGITGRVDVQEKAIDGTMWEVAILMGLPGVGRKGSFFVAAALIGNLLVQIFFVYVLQRSVEKVDVYGSDTIDSFKRWRNTAGHDFEYMDRARWMSMTGRLCDLSMPYNDYAISSLQRERLEEIDFYMSSLKVIGFDFIGTGHTIVTLALAIWTMIVLKELWNAVHFMEALGHLPRGSTKFERLHSGKMQLLELGTPRFFFMVSVTGVRMLVAVLLLFFGCRWIARTTVITDIFLDCVALAFVLEVDELFFHNFMPLPTKLLVQSLAPLSRPTRLFSGIDPPPVLNTIIGSIYVGVVLHSMVFPYTTHMQAARDALCGHKRDFVVGVQASTGMIISTQLESIDSSDYVNVSSLFGEAVDEAVACDDRHLGSLLSSFANGCDLSRSYFQPRRYMFENKLSESISKMADEVITCDDYAFGEGASGVNLLPYIHTLRRLTGLGDEDATCATFLQSCHLQESQLLRYACPVTCGCRSPQSGLFLNGPLYGCPREACRQSSEYQQELFGLSCQDPSLFELNAIPGWQSWVNQLEGFVQRKRDEDGVDVAIMALMDNAVTALRAYGCDALAGSREVKHLFCERHFESFSSLHGFCPEACGCDEHCASTCPRTCRSCAAGGASASGVRLISSDSGVQ